MTSAPRTFPPAAFTAASRPGDAAPPKPQCMSALCLCFWCQSLDKVNHPMVRGGPWSHAERHRCSDRLNARGLRGSHPLGAGGRWARTATRLRPRHPRPWRDPRCGGPRLAGGRRGLYGSDHLGAHPAAVVRCSGPPTIVEVPSSASGASRSLRTSQPRVAIEPLCVTRPPSVPFLPMSDPSLPSLSTSESGVGVPARPLDTVGVVGSIAPLPTTWRTPDLSSSCILRSADR
jgi:hypothetical protein